MNICVYGASSSSIDEIYTQAVCDLGTELARRGMGLIFGGGAQGLMGAAARSAHAAGGRIIGVAPTFFDVDGVLFEHCTELIRTDTMRTRKQRMEELADAFIMVPGGFGTFDEFFEMLTLRQLGRHDKPIVIYNINGYYNPLFELIEHAMEQNFIKRTCQHLYFIAETPKQALDYIENYTPTAMDVARLRGLDGGSSCDEPQE